jgi:type VI secretion system protein ImpM
MPALPADARPGFYGKLPSRGDFVRENLPRDFAYNWDAWWQRGLAETQRRPQEEWLDAWLEAPVWRFVLPPGLCGAGGVLGLWMPSVDKAGRYFPLTIAATAENDWATCVGPMTSFLEEAEAAGRDALEQDLPPAALARRIQEAFTASDAPTLAPEVNAGEAAWWTAGGPRVAARFEAGAALPEGGRFAALIDDRWGEPQPVPAVVAGDAAEPS